MWNWLKAHKSLVGVIVGVVSAGLRVSPWASKATPIVDALSAFLIGAGVLPSDSHTQDAQDAAQQP